MKKGNVLKDVPFFHTLLDANLRHCGQGVPFPKSGRRPIKRGKRQRSSESVANVHERGDLSASRRFESYLRSQAESHPDFRGGFLLISLTNYEPTTLRSRGAVPEARPAADKAREKAANDLFRTQFFSLKPLAKVWNAYEKTPNDLFRTQFFSLKTLVKVRHAYEKTPNDLFRTQFLSLKPSGEGRHAYEKTPNKLFRMF